MIGVHQVLRLSDDSVSYIGAAVIYFGMSWSWFTSTWYGWRGSRSTGIALIHSGMFWLAWIKSYGYRLARSVVAGRRRASP